MAATKVISGARLLASIGGSVFVWGTNVSFGEEIQYEAAEVLDSLEIKEWVPVGYRTNLSAGLFRTVGTGSGEGSLKQQGLMPRNSGNPNQILVSEPMTMSLLDRVTDDKIIGIEGVKLASYSIAVTPRGLLGTDVSFVAIRARDMRS